MRKIKLSGLVLAVLQIICFQSYASEDSSMSQYQMPRGHSRSEGNSLGAYLDFYGAATLSQLNINQTIEGTDLGKSTATPPGVSSSAGVSLGLPLGNFVSFELGVCYLQRSTVLSSDGYSLTLKYVQVPALMRLWISRYFSVAAGGYAAFRVGNVSGTTEGTGSSPLNSDYGLIGSIGARIPVSSEISFLLEGRYNYGLDNIFSTSVASSGQTTDFGYQYRDVEALIGLGIQL